MKSILKYLLRFLLVLMVVFMAAFFAIVIFQQKFSDKIVEQINTYIKVPVQAESLQFSLLNNFPNASLQLNNVVVYSAAGINVKEFDIADPDVLLRAKRIYISVKLFKLLQNTIEIAQIDFQSAHMNVLVDHKGNDNYAVLSAFSQIEAKDSNELSVKLDQFEFKDVTLNFQNIFKATKLRATIPKYRISGDFYKENYKISSSGKIMLEMFQQGELHFNPKDESSLNLNMQFNNDTIYIHEGTFLSQEIKLGIEGMAVLGSKKYLNLKFSGYDIQVADAMAMYAAADKKVYGANGIIKLSGNVQGNFSKVKSPAIHTTFEIENGRVALKDKGLILNKCYLKGSFTNGKYRNLESSVLNINNLKIAINESYISAYVNLKNLKNPELEVHTDFKFNVNDVSNILTGTKYQLYGGSAAGKCTLVGPVKNMQSFSDVDFSAVKLNAQLMCNENNFIMKGLKAENLNTSIRIKNNGVHIQSFQSRVNGSELRSSGYINDLLPYLQNKSNLKVQAELTASDINYQAFRDLIETESSDRSNKPGIDLNIKFLLNSVSWNKLTAKRASGNLSYINDNLVVKDYRLNSFDGALMGSLSYKAIDTNSYRLETKSQAFDVNVNKLFKAFDNFDQNTLSDKHIYGNLSTDFTFQMVFENGKAISSSTDFLGHVQISDGRLLNFKPIMDVAKFSEIEELEDIRFSTIENDLLITDAVIYIPEMNISSNAFDLKLHGQQYFNGDYEYHVRVFMSDFLSGKANRLQKQQSEFGYVADDGYGRRPLVLLVESYSGKDKVSIDKAALKKNIKSNLTEEKAELKTVLKKEFGWFKKDTTLKNEKVKQPAFQIEWDDN